MGLEETTEIIKAAAYEAAREAIKEYNKAELKKDQKKVLRNTRLLLSHYTELKCHYECAKYRTEDIIAVKFDGDRIDITKGIGEDVHISSIKRSKMVTMIMLSHIDTCLDLLSIKAHKDKYEVLFRLYIDPYEMEWMEKIKKLSDELHISEATVRRWESEMVNELSVFLFGVDGLKVF